MGKKLFFILLVAIIALPAIAFAVDFNAGTHPAFSPDANHSTLILMITGVFGLLWIAFIAFAIIMFIVAGFQFLSAQGEPDGLGKARKAVIWGIVGVILAIVAFLLPFIIRDALIPPAAPAVIDNGGAGDEGGGGGAEVPVTGGCCFPGFPGVGGNFGVGGSVAHCAVWTQNACESWSGAGDRTARYLGDGVPCPANAIAVCQ